MNGFELGSSRIRSDLSANCATYIAHVVNLVGITDQIVLKSLIKHATRLHPHDICLDVFIVHFYFTDLSYSFHFFLCLSMPPGAKTIKLILQ